MLVAKPHSLVLNLGCEMGSLSAPSSGKSSVFSVYIWNTKMFNRIFLPSTVVYQDLAPLNGAKCLSNG